MSLARLDLLGGFRLTSREGETLEVPAKKNRALLGILAVAPNQEATRHKLAALLWSDRGEEQARDSLRQALATIRKDFAELGADALALVGDRVALNPKFVTIDVVEFVAVCGSRDAVELRQAATLYTGPFLDGLGTSDNAFEDWLREVRADLSLRAIDLFERLAESVSGTERVATAERLVALDPLREPSHVALIQAHIALGQTALAIKQYEACKLLLKRELNLKPGDELQLLKQTIDELSKPQTGDASSHRPVIAVLPFENMSGDPSQAYFSDGITEDIITELGRFGELHLIARNSSFVFKDGLADAATIAKQLSVDYRLQGSTRRAGDRVRISSQLVEARSGNQIWADRFDRELTDIFELQDEIARSVAITVVGTIRTSAVEKIRRLPISQLDAYDLYLQARVRMVRYDTVLEAEPYLVRAIELDPNVATTHAMMAIMLTVKWLLEGDGDTLKTALAHSRRALKLGPKQVWSHMAMGHALIFTGELEEALLHLEQAVNLNPNESRARAIRALCRNYLGRHEEALADLDVCIARDPLNYDWLWDLRGQVLLVLGRYPEAIASYRNLNSYAFWAHAFLAVCHWRMGDEQLAAHAARECLAARQGATVSTILIDPYRNPKILKDLRRDLLAVGIPDG
ncbi:BTAD domain-containing putative transcriptional regulator [Mesorhizobium sp. XAP10]|uniref:BTAD domain-containing putative transcriptional regulator n=1 Tax=unclassified Mesorhizobium TaxID=325217 RepID=UPI0023DE94EB|nr:MULTISPECIES: BTAD domain-containing putative transcriptional regulator [unclassified Mesorhizobium]MDF3152465.1 BTAD domain-containing putative transcriptional regulator [Mesorhizobium sp. XAP10]MDF3245525.1 BTAD domain-containing putative transcriptional regulator [Mesorhizobium sp. XAP4]